MQVVLSSATEAEMGALFYNAKDAAWLHTTLHDLGHPQPPTPIQRTDNACAAGIVNHTVKQRWSKAIDMRFYWVCNRVQQKQFIVHWRPGSDNLADYFTKHHSPSHHRCMRDQYLLPPPGAPTPSTPPRPTPAVPLAGCTFSPVGAASAHHSALSYMGRVCVLRTPTVSYRFPDLLTQHDVTPMTTQPKATPVFKPLINYQFIDYHYS